METQLNRVMLRGFVGAVRTQKLDGTVLSHLSLATNYAYKDRQGCAVIETTWHEIFAFEGKHIRRDVLENLKRGDKLYVEGRIVNRRLVDSEGIERTITEIRASKLETVDADNLRYE